MRHLAKPRMPEGDSGDNGLCSECNRLRGKAKR
jgi:hypothetical protein